MPERKYCTTLWYFILDKSEEGGTLHVDSKNHLSPLWLDIHSCIVLVHILCAFIDCRHQNSLTQTNVLCLLFRVLNVFKRSGNHPKAASPQKLESPTFFSDTYLFHTLSSCSRVAARNRTLISCSSQRPICDLVTKVLSGTSEEPCSEAHGQPPLSSSQIRRAYRWRCFMHACVWFMEARERERE